MNFTGGSWPPLPHPSRSTHVAVSYMGDLTIIMSFFFKIYILVHIMICFSYKISVCGSLTNQLIHTLYEDNIKCFHQSRFFFQENLKIWNSMCVNKTKRKQIITWCDLKSERVEVDIRLQYLPFESIGKANELELLNIHIYSNAQSYPKMNWTT